MDGVGKKRYILNKIRPKILENRNYYIAELQHDMRQMELNEIMKNKIYDLLNIPQGLRTGYYHEVIIVKVDEDDEKFFKGVLEKYK